MSLKCEICGEEWTCRSLSVLGVHLDRHHKEVSKKEYYEKYIVPGGKCIACDKELGKYCPHSRTYKNWSVGIFSLKDQFIAKHGKEQGEKLYTKWKQGCEPGKDATIRRHGKDKGTELWNEVIERKKWKNSKAGLQETFGDDYAKLAAKLNTRKTTLDKFVEKYGEEEGRKRCHEKWQETTQVNIKYWLKKGLTKKQAKAEVSKRQHTFSLEKCVEKYGEEEGRKRFEERQIKWQATLNSQSEEEKARILKLKVKGGCSCGGISTAEKELQAILQCESQIYISGKAFDLGFINKKKVIEYNGDYWHCNPAKYTAEYVRPNGHIPATKIWKNDAKKKALAEKAGYEVLVIWENDYEHNKNEVIEKCKKFLEGK